MTKILLTLLLLGLINTNLLGLAQSTSALETSQETSANYGSKQKKCPDNDPTYIEAETTRTVNLPQFGIQINIPSNYRAMLHHDGRVEILEPTIYEIIKCVYEGGYVENGSGYGSRSIKLIPNPLKLSILELTNDYKSVYSVFPYSFQGLDGYLFVNGISDSYYWVEIPGIEGVVVFTEACDCGSNIEVDIQSMAEIEGSCDEVQPQKNCDFLYQFLARMIRNTNHNIAENVSF